VKEAEAALEVARGAGAAARVGTCRLTLSIPR